jgi:hypothetical protein
MTVLFSGTWGRSYKCITSDLNQLPLIKTVMSEVTRLCDLTQAPLIKTIMSEVILLYDLPQVPMITTVISFVLKTNFKHDRFNQWYLGVGHINVYILT